MVILMLISGEWGSVKLDGNSGFNDWEICWIGNFRERARFDVTVFHLYVFGL